MSHTYLDASVSPKRLSDECRALCNMVYRTELSHPAIILADRGYESYLHRNFDGDDVRLARTFLGCGGYSVVRLWLLEDMEKTPKEIEALVQKLLNNDLFQ